MHVSEESMREALGAELSDMLYRQKAIVLCNEKLRFWNDAFVTMADDDEQDLQLLETAISAYGIRVGARRSTEQIADLVIDVVAGATSMPLEKLNAYTLLKQNQAMSSHLIRRALPEVLADIKLALAPLEHLQANLDRHCRQLQDFMERTGVSWVTGHELSEGILSRARDAVSGLTDRVLSKVIHPAQDLDILAVLRTDHRKVQLLFQEIDEAKTHERALAIFRQLKTDLNAHSIAEEEVVYARFQDLAGLHELLSESRQDHADMRVLLEEAQGLQDEHEAFLDRIDELQQLVQQHVEEEEDQLFKLIRKNSSDELRKDLTQNFLKTKQRIQANIRSDNSSTAAPGHEPAATL